MQILEGLYTYLWQGQGNNCNTYAIKYAVDGKACIALVDPGHVVVQAPEINQRTGRATGYYEEAALSNLLKAMEKDGTKLSDLGLIIFTHCHPDHIEAGIALAGMSEARVAFHEAEMPAFRRIMGKSERKEKGQPNSASRVFPDFFLKEGELVLGNGPGKAVIDVIHAPGHSAGSICLYWKEKKVLFAGDVVFYGNTGRYDLPGGSRSVLRESIVRLSRLDVEYLLTGHPYGHPGVIGGKKDVDLNFSLILNHVLP